jgi:hypothetical protein
MQATGGNSLSEHPLPVTVLASNPIERLVPLVLMVAGLVVLCVLWFTAKVVFGPIFNRPAPALVDPEILALALRIKQTTQRQATILVPDQTLSLGRPLETHVGNVLALGKNETWPRNPIGKPLGGLMQVNLTELAQVPDELKGIAFVSVFWDGEMFGGKGVQWAGALVREYVDLSDLRPVHPLEAPPSKRTALPARPVDYVDFGPWDRSPDLVPDWESRSPEWREALERAVADRPDDTELIGWGCKVGGWPAPVQYPIARPVTLQVGDDPEFGDAGCLYCWRVQTPDGWKWEFHLDSW